MGKYTNYVTSRYNNAQGRPNFGSKLWVNKERDNVTAMAMDYVRIQGFVLKLIRVHSHTIDCTVRWSSDVAKLGAAGAADIKKREIYLSAGPYEKFETAEDIYDVYSGIALHEVSHLIHSEFAEPQSSDPPVLWFYDNLFEDERIEARCDLESPNFSWYTKRIKDLILDSEPTWSQFKDDPDTKLDMLLSRWVRDWIRVPYLMPEEQLQWHPIVGRNMYDEVNNLIDITPAASTYNSRELALKIVKYIASLYVDLNLEVPPQYNNPYAAEVNVTQIGESEEASEERNSSSSGASGSKPPITDDMPTDKDSMAGEGSMGDGEVAEDRQDESASACTEDQPEGTPENDEGTEAQGQENGQPHDSIKGRQSHTPPKYSQSTINRVTQDEKNINDHIKNEERYRNETGSISGTDPVHIENLTKSIAKDIPEIAMTRDVALVPEGNLVDISSELVTRIQEIVETNTEVIPPEYIAGLHRQVVVRSPRITLEVSQQYKRDYDLVRGHVAAFARIFAVRQSEVEVYQNELRRGRLNRRALGRAQSTDALFRRKDVHTTTGLDITLLLDESGSMYGDKIIACRRTGVLLANALKTIPNVNLSIYGHTTGDAFGGRSEDCVVTRYVEQGHGDLTRLGACEAYYSNLDGLAITYVGNRALQSTAVDRWLVVLSDGQPAGYGYGGEQGQNHTRQSIQDLERKGLNVIGVGIDSVYVKELYKHYVEFTDLSKLSVDLRKLVMRIIRNSTEAGMVM